MNRFLYLFTFAIYIAITGMVFMLKMPVDQTWVDQWIFDKFFVFQFISVLSFGLAIEGGYFHHLTAVRIGNRRTMLFKELLRSYTLGLICLTIMFIIVIAGALSLAESSFMLRLTDWYFRYCLGVMLFINVISCLKWSSNMLFRRYYILIAFLWLALELLVFCPSIRNMYGHHINLLFSWIFDRRTESYYWMGGFIIMTILLNIRLSDKRDFV